ncbi:MAG: protein-export rane protein SecD [Anaerocolumna sp.]|jgi:protein-export SecD/SecF family membrane protein|nr:protein-export rane protein SecD [Anaerocolumna sp.]
MKNRKPVFFIVLFIAIIMAYCAKFGVSITVGTTEFKILGAPKMRFGIDIRGGVDAVYEPEELDRKATSDELEAARSIIEARLDQKNILDRDVTIDKDNGYIIVRFPWKADETEFNPEDAMAELGQTAQLTFCDEEGNVLLEGSHVKKSTPQRSNSTNGFVVSLIFDEEGTRLFSEATEKLVGKIINIYMDDTLIQSAKVSEHISSGKAQISGMPSLEAAKNISDKINSGSLPFSMTTKNHSTISPTLGAGSLDIMLEAGFIAFCIISALLILYYRLPGFVACISLIIQISGQILALSVPQITLTLTGIAGVILSIGMGVDANIIVSERINEEIKSGKSVQEAITSGFKGAFSSVFDGNITVLIVAVVLSLFGSGSLLSFAYSLLTGIFFNFVAGVTASRLMIRSLSNFKLFSKPGFYTCRSRRITYEQE